MQGWLPQPYRAKVTQRVRENSPQEDSWGSAAWQGAKSRVCHLAAVCARQDGHLTALRLSFSLIRELHDSWMASGREGVPDPSLKTTINLVRGPRTYQAVKAAAKQVHGAHLHRGGGQGRAGDRRPEVQVEKVAQQVALRGDGIQLLSGGRSSGGRLWALRALTPAGTWGEAQQGRERCCLGEARPRLRDLPPGEASGLLTVLGACLHPTSSPSHP